MKKIGAYEAKTRLPFLLRQVGLGQSFTITKRGEPIALLCPAPQPEKDEIHQTIQKIKDFGTRFKLGHFDIKKLISEGRR